MDSLGPQLDSAIEAALRMLEGNMGSSRWNKKPDNKDKISVRAINTLLFTNITEYQTDRQRMLEGNTGRPNNKEKDDNKDIIRINAIRTLC